MNPLPPQTRIRILASAKTGHVVPCIGLAQALGIEPEIVPVRPRALYGALAPWGPADPRDASFREPYPDIAIASARETVPVLRALKRRSAGLVFTVYLGDPRSSRDIFDLVWMPEHDSAQGANIIKTLTAPHPHGMAALETARANPDPRIAGLPSPRIAVLIGGPSGQFAFGEQDIQAVCAALEALLAQGASLAVSTSRRTPSAIMEKLGVIAADPKARGRMFLWTGQGDNPYRAMLALADAFLVTADSVNMIGEAAASGKPVYVVQLAGDAGKFAHFFKEMEARGAARAWSGLLQDRVCEPIDATPEIAAEIARRYGLFRAAMEQHR